MRVGRECKQGPTAAWNFWTARETSRGWEGTRGPHRAISAMGLIEFEYCTGLSPISAWLPGRRCKLTALPPVANWTLVLFLPAVIVHYCPWLLYRGAGTVGSDQPTGRGPRWLPFLPLPVSGCAGIEAVGVSHPLLFPLCRALTTPGCSFPQIISTPAWTAEAEKSSLGSQHQVLGLARHRCSIVFVGWLDEESAWSY